MAFAIVGIGLGASLALLITAGVTNRRTELRAVAANLARETIEVARGIRDSNWLAEASFDQGLVAAAAGDIVGTPVFDPTVVPPTWQLNFDGDVDPAQSDDRVFLGSSPSATVYSNVYVQKLAGFSAPPVFATATQFRRWFQLPSICASSETTLTLGPCPLGDKKVGLVVQSFVEWTDRGQTNQIQLDERLYDWKL